MQELPRAAFGPAISLQKDIGQIPARSAPTRPMGAFPWLQLCGAPGRLDRTPDAGVAEASPEYGRTRFNRGGSIRKQALVRDALGERQKSLTLLALATESADPRLHQGERCIMGHHLFG